MQLTTGASHPGGTGEPPCACPGIGAANIGGTGNDGVSISNLGSTGNDGILASDSKVSPTVPKSPGPQVGSGCCGGGAMPAGFLFAPVMFIGWKWRIRRRQRRR